ncbi:MAG: ATP-binding cassette domain-containing protein [Clostridia bacterium]|nr:ATP-binding cassette domain-containing protein [Clostridia bacterium]
MQDLDKTTRSGYVRQPMGFSGNLIVTIFDGSERPRAVSFSSFGKPVITFGRGSGNDIVLSSPIVSSLHGRFIFRDGRWFIEDRELFGEKPSLNGLLYNNTPIVARALSEGDFVRIDDSVETISKGVLFVFAPEGSSNRWETLPLQGQQQVTIGRAPENGIVLSHVSVSKRHATISFEGGEWYITDNGSTNGVVINNNILRGKQRLHEKDVIVITNSKLIFTSSAIFYCTYRSGISVDTSNVVIQHGKGKRSFTTGVINLNIHPGELVAIVGGSGAGKSTIMNCMCGYLTPVKGDVYINGVNLYRNFDTLKKIMGYVPQSDIVYDNLTLYDMLSYTAKLRLPSDTTDAEREAAIARAIRMVELTEKKNNFIKSLSGGQKKRASIAVELLSDPNLLFLDEPSSGLDPGTERNLMKSLRNMADNGKTIILVTHSTLQLRMCDKIIFMGKGGKLCFFGSHDEALKFFGVDDIVDVYNEITDHSQDWSDRYYSTVGRGSSRPVAASAPTVTKNTPRSQLPVLCARYFKLVFNDKQRLLLLLLQAPVLALLIAMVADKDVLYKQYEMTKSLLFMLSCAGIWVGMLNAIQEVCKERSILKREYMTGLSLGSYIASKMVVLGVMCLIQAFLIVSVFAIAVGLPSSGLMFGAYLEFLITVFLTAISSTAMGLFVSSLFKNADRAMTVAPILLMPQILFSGLLFKLEGATKAISWFAISRWSMEALGTTADLNGLDHKIAVELQDKYPMLDTSGLFEKESFFETEVGHMLLVWLILIFFTAAFLVLSRIVLRNIGKEKN